MAARATSRPRAAAATLLLAVVALSAARLSQASSPPDEAIFGDMKEHEYPGGILPDAAAARELLQTARAGPLPGVRFIPGFPGLGGTVPGVLTSPDLSLLRRRGIIAGGPGLGLGAAAAAGVAADVALAGYVISAQDPVAIALRQLSIVAIEAFGESVAAAVERAFVAIDAELERYAEYIGRVVDEWEDAETMEPLLSAAQSTIRLLELERASIEDIGARWGAYISYLTEATSSWTSWVYGIQYRLTSVSLSLLSQNDPIALEYVRVLYSYSDSERLVGLVLRPFIREFQQGQDIFIRLEALILDEYIKERKRLTITPVATLENPIGSGENLQAIADDIVGLSETIGSGERIAGLVAAATAGRNAVRAALSLPAADGSSAAGLASALRGGAAGGSAGAGLRGGVAGLFSAFG